MVLYLIQISRIMIMKSKNKILSTTIPDTSFQFSRKYEH